MKGTLLPLQKFPCITLLLSFLNAIVASSSDSKDTGEKETVKSGHTFGNCTSLLADDLSALCSLEGEYASTRQVQAIA